MIVKVVVMKVTAVVMMVARIVGPRFLHEKKLKMFLICPLYSFHAECTLFTRARLRRCEVSLPSLASHMGLYVD